MRRGRPVGSKTKNKGMVIENAKPNKFKRIKVSDQIKDVLEKKGEISMSYAHSKGWTTIRQYIAYFKKNGMNIECVKTDKGLVYKLIDNTKVKENTKTESIETIKNKTEIKTVEKSDYATVLEHLNEFGSITSKEANDKYGILSLPSVIFNLRKKGYDITTSKTREIKEQGVKVDRVKSYSVFTLNSKGKKTTKYMVVAKYDGRYSSLIDVTSEKFDFLDDAGIRAQYYACNLSHNLNDIAGGNVFTYANDDYRKFTVKKVVKTKKLFKTKTNITEIATFEVVEVME